MTSVRSWIRKAHRVLAVVVGVQILAWIAGGVYFSWSELAWIRGETLRRPLQPVQAIDWVRLADALAALQAEGGVVEQVELLPCLEQTMVRVRLRFADSTQYALLSAEGRRLAPLDREKAIALAREALRVSSAILAVEYLREVPAGHEYRGRPLPAWAIHFAHPGRPTVYVAAERAEVTAIRHDGWRLFDFLWMLHTLDFPGRDDFNNPGLRAVSLAALLTVASGYLLFGVSARRRRFKARPVPPQPETIGGLQAKPQPSQRQ